MKIVTVSFPSKGLLGTLHSILLVTHKETMSFINLNMGKSIIHTKWTILIMPSHINEKLHTISHRKPRGLAFRDLNDQVILDKKYTHDNGDDEPYAPCWK